jgi:hypothetical protein
MPAEAFDIKRQWSPDRGKHCRMQIVQCSTCEAADTIPITTDNPLPPEKVAKIFGTRGWEIGRRRNADKCPNCAKRGKAKPMESKPALSASPALQVVRPQAAASAPREPSVEDRRIIYEAINDHYLGADKGYDTGWDDQRIASDLNVPRKWIEDIRELLFGPATDPARTALLSEFRKLEAQLAALTTNSADLRVKFADLKERLHKKGILA